MGSRQALACAADDLNILAQGMGSKAWCGSTTSNHWREATMAAGTTSKADGEQRNN
jgi:hypothetical protein